MSVSVEAIDVRRRNNVTESGNPTGQPIIFAHGFGCSQEVWREVAPHFEADFRVILFDHVGAGGSDISAYDAVKYDSLHGYADDVLDILNELDLRDAIFVGHSVSSMVGVLAANRDASRFAQLVLVGPSPSYINEPEYFGGFDRSDIDSLLEALDANYLGWSATMAPVIIGNPEQPHLGEALTASFCSIEPRIARHFAHVTFLSDNRVDLRDVSVPTLVIQCTDDVIAPLEVGTFVHEEIPGSTLIVIPTRGHVPILSGPTEVVAAIRSFVND